MFKSQLNWVILCQIYYDFKNKRILSDILALKKIHPQNVSK